MATNSVSTTAVADSESLLDLVDAIDLRVLKVQSVAELIAREEGAATRPDTMIGASLIIKDLMNEISSLAHQLHQIGKTSVEVAQ